VAWCEAFEKFWSLLNNVLQIGLNLHKINLNLHEMGELEESLIIGRFLAGILGLLYVYFFIEATASGHVRKGWLFRNISSAEGALYYLIAGNDLFCGLVFLWLAFLQTSFLYGRTITLFFAHLAIVIVFLTDMRTTDSDGKHSNPGLVVKPILFGLAIYWFYLVLIAGVSLADVLEAIAEFFED
jgi:hypothetical protein